MDMPEDVELWPGTPQLSVSRWNRGGLCMTRMSIPGSTALVQTSLCGGYWNAQFPCRRVQGLPYMLKTRPLGNLMLAALSWRYVMPSQSSFAPSSD